MHPFLTRKERSMNELLLLPHSYSFESTEPEAPPMPPKKPEPKEFVITQEDLQNPFGHMKANGTNSSNAMAFKVRTTTTVRPLNDERGLSRKAVPDYIYQDEETIQGSYK